MNYRTRKILDLRKEALTYYELVPDEYKRQAFKYLLATAESAQAEMFSRSERVDRESAKAVFSRTAPLVEKIEKLVEMGELDFPEDLPLEGVMGAIRKQVQG